MGLVLAINTIQISGILQATITTNNYFSSDTFSVTCAMGGPPLCDIQWWSNLSDAYAELSYIGGPLQYLGGMIAGDIDFVAVDPILQVVTFEGRDLSARLIDSYLQKDFVNQTASEVVSSLAAQFSLAVEIVPTQGNIGRFFEDGYTKLTLGQFSALRSNWDLVVQLAREQDYDVFVNGTTLWFQPADGTDATTVYVTPQSVTKMRIEQNLSVPASAAVTVQSWNSQLTAAYRSTAPANDASSASDTTSQTGGYLFSGTNLTSDQADTSASQYNSEITRLRITLHLEMPWDFAFAPRGLIALSNTNSSFDGIFKIDALERHYSSTSGSTQIVRAAWCDRSI